MRRMHTPFRMLGAYAAIAVALFPGSASALTLVQFLGLFHLFVGLFLAATLLVFASGVFVYFARLGTWPTHRDTAIEVMEWAIAMLFVLIVILGLVQFFQRYPGIALPIFAVVIIVAVLFFILRAAARSSAKKKKEAKPGPPPGPH